MGGKIYLDDNYNSGVPGHPGTRFVIDLCTSSICPTALDKIMGENVDTTVAKEQQQKADTAQSSHDAGSSTKALQQQFEEDCGSITSVDALPETLSVLFVDDDSVLRKLFSRALRRIRPAWNIREAANGETALQLVESGECSFDLIFMDMYMASVEKQLLGTEAVSALRLQGVTSRICGLSANDIEQEFFDAGADSFMFKPFPCDEKSMTKALWKILYEDDSRSGFRVAANNNSNSNNTKSSADAAVGRER